MNRVVIQNPDKHPANQFFERRLIIKTHIFVEKVVLNYFSIDLIDGSSIKSIEK